MIGHDQLTKEERIKLEAFAQIGVRHAMRPTVIDIDAHISEAEVLAKWLQKEIKNA